MMPYNSPIIIDKENRTVSPIFRFAPSPNGHLHLGHAYSALLNARMASAHHGKLLLRIEDIDTARSKPQLIKTILDDMAWLEIPFEPDIRYQSEHFALYAQAAEKLTEQGLLYPCFCTRSDSAKNATDPKDPDGAPRYAQTCKHLSKGEIAQRQAKDEPHSWRLDSAAASALTGQLYWQEIGQEMESESSDTGTTIEANLAQWGDIILIRKDTPTSYHLAVTLCDAAQKITHIVRGKDLYHATAIHRTLQVLLGLPEPLYCHHKLITDEAMNKLSKSKKSPSLKSLRAQGWTRNDILKQLNLG